MNYKEDLDIKLQKVNLAIAEINDYEFDTDKQRKLKLKIILKDLKLNLNYQANS